MLAPGLALLTLSALQKNQILIILVYNIFSVAVQRVKLALLEELEPCAMLTCLLEELQKKYYILKSSEFNFLKGRQG